MDMVCLRCGEAWDMDYVLHEAPHGHVCEGCRTYYDQDLHPIARILQGAL
jgi:hypothetical protein